MTTRRQFLSATALGAAGAFAAGCSSSSTTSASSEKLTTVNFGYISDLNGAGPLSVASSRGLWAKYGLSPSLKNFSTGPVQVEALTAGDLDFAYLGPGAIWLPAEGKAKIIAIDTLQSADRVIARPGTGISTIADLKGKKVGVPTGTSGEMILYLALAKAGLTLSDVQQVSMQPATIVTAMSSGQIDAAGLWYPLVATIKKEVPGLLELADDDDFASQLRFPTVYVSQEDLPSSNPSLVKKVLKVIQEAQDLAAADPSGTAETVASFIQEDASTMTALLPYTQYLTAAQISAYTSNGSVDTWLNGLAKVFVKMKELTSIPSPSSYYDGSLYTSVAG